MPDRVTIDYTNWRGERRERDVLPHSIVFEATRWHPEPQWLLRAVDLEDYVPKEFAMKDIHSWKPAKEKRDG